MLLISLGMVSFSYIKWIKKTFLLQIIVLVLTILLLLLGYIIQLLTKMKIRLQSGFFIFYAVANVYFSINVACL